MGRTNLLTRLLILVVVATAPAVAGLVYLQMELRADRLDRLREDVIRQAELVSADVGSIVEGARQLTLALSHSDHLRHLGSACAAGLKSLRADVPSYTELLVVTEAGGTVCSTADATAPNPPALTALAASALREGRFTAGVFLPATPGNSPQLPFANPFTTADGQRAVVIAALSLDWLQRHLDELRRAPNSAITVAGHDGVTLARLPVRAGYAGTVAPAAKSLVNAAHRGTAMLTGFDGVNRLVGYIPATEPPVGFYVGVGYSLPDMTPDIDRVARRGYAIVGLGAALAMLLTLLMAEHFVRRPTRALVGAAQRWSSGDMSARASLGASAAREFAKLAAALNAMADAFHWQRSELQHLNNTLEARVEERTRELVASRNQLQVEVAEREKTEASLQQAQKLQAIGQLAGGIAHDFNNMLTTVTGALELLRRRMPAGSEGLLRLVADALAATERGGRLTVQLLAFARRQRLLPAPTDLNAVIAGLSNLLQSTLDRSIRLDRHMDEALWPAMVDQAQVEAAILNLALNARDAMETGGVLTIATCNVQRRPQDSQWETQRTPPGDYVAVRVTDTGTGMSPEILQRVFEPFFTTKPPGRGSGLGLSQVHGLAVQSGGDVTVESGAGGGTQVTLLLPRAHVPARASPDLLVGDSPRRGNARVLIVDDDDTVRAMVGEMLEEAGYTVRLTAGALEALDVLAGDDAYDLMLADYAMPGMNGIVLLEQVRERYPLLRSLLVTGFAEFRAAEALGPEQIVRKPFTIRALVDRVERVLAQPPRGHPARVADR